MYLSVLLARCSGDNGAAGSSARFEPTLLAGAHVVLGWNSGVTTSQGVYGGIPISTPRAYMRHQSYYYIRSPSAGAFTPIGQVRNSRLPFTLLKPGGFFEWQVMRYLHRAICTDQKKKKTDQVE